MRLGKARSAVASLLVVCIASLVCVADDSARGVLVETLRPGLSIVIDKGSGAQYVYGETLSVTVTNPPGPVHL
jgi:folate-dependent tRNA-U54 methylase TrmFO/GidA